MWLIVNVLSSVMMSGFMLDKDYEGVIVMLIFYVISFREIVNEN